MQMDFHVLYFCGVTFLQFRLALFPAIESLVLDPIWIQRLLFATDLWQMLKIFMPVYSLHT